MPLPPIFRGLCAQPSPPGRHNRRDHHVFLRVLWAARARRLRASGTGDNKVMGSVADDPATDRPREWLALPGGGIRPVVSVPGPGGIAELLAYGAWLARLRPACRCGKPRLGSGRTCGGAACVAELRVQEPGR